MTQLRDDILAILNGNKIPRTPCFSGLISVTQPGLEAAGLSFHETHRDAGKMAAAAASTFRLSGFGSAVVPFDMGVEAEALGAEIDFRESAGAEIPRVRQAPYQTIAEIPLSPIPYPLEAGERGKGIGRLRIICDALRMLKQDVGTEIAIGACVPGPFTLLFLLVEAGSLFEAFKWKPEALHRGLTFAVEVIAESARAYRAAGADFVTIHEMGGAPSVLGPARFETFVLPALKSLVARIPSPRVLAVCGRIDAMMPAIETTKADAYSLDQSSDIAAARAALGPETVLLGNVDPVGVLSNGSMDDVRRSVRESIAAGVDAIWPGCDLWPILPEENLIAMTEETRAVGQR